MNKSTRKEKNNPVSNKTNGFSINTQPQNIATNFVTSDQLEKAKDNLTVNFITVLGIFASIVTFLLIEIQILKNVCDFMRLLGFSSFVLAGIIAFIFLLLLFINEFRFTTTKKILTVCLSLILVSLFYLSYSLVKNSPDEFTCKVINLNDAFEKLEIRITNDMNQKNIELDQRVRFLENTLLNQKLKR